MNTATNTTPSIWLVISDKLGDNAQVTVLAERLGLPTERRELRFKQRWIQGKPPFEANLDHIDLENSAPLTPPWPDLIITIGRRPAMAALWIKRQSGGHTKIVLIGRPKRYFSEFDLVIATGQYRLPARSNVIRLPLPLMRSDPNKVSAEADAWRERFSKLPRPLTALFIGGQTKPFRLDAEAAKALLAKSVQAAGAGHLYISTSRRTPETVISYLREQLPDNATLYYWSPEAGDNPYLALLGLADRFIVTGDSVSMMVEVAHLGRPLMIAPLPLAGGMLGRLTQVLGRKLLLSTAQTGGINKLRDYLFERGLFGYPRDLEGFHKLLCQEGLASFPEDGFVTSVRGIGEDPAIKAAAAVRNLLPDQA